MAKGRIRRTATFAGAASRYWLEVFGSARRELGVWRSRAEEIPDPLLREKALRAQRAKNGNAEGLAAFAVLAPRRQRRNAVRALVAYQTALDYLDTITDPPRDLDELKLHLALEVAVGDDRTLEQFEAEIADRDDRRYLFALIGACRESLVALPSYDAVRPALRRRARLGAAAQEMNHSLLVGRPECELADWALAVGRTSGLDGELCWWETFAAGASTPALGALVALAARADVAAAEVAVVEHAYFPWVNALNTLLDNLIDLDEDPVELRHIERYGSAEQAAERLREIAARARAAVAGLPNARRHELIVAAMGAYYLAQPAAWRGERAPIAAAVLEELGPFARPAVWVHRLRRGRGGDREAGTQSSAQPTWQARATVAVSGPPAAKK